MADKEYIERGALIENLKKQYGEELGWQCTVNMSDVGMMIEDATAADVVSRYVLEQVKWERDMAMQQLEEHGIPFCGVADDVVKVVRCKDCKHYHRYTDRHTNEPSHWGRCTSISMDIDLMANDYCCYGERKEQT